VLEKLNFSQDIKAPEGLPLCNDYQSVVSKLHEYSAEKHLKWVRSNNLRPEEQAGKQIIETTFNDGGKKFSLYLQGLVPELVYIFDHQELIALHINNLDLDKMIVTRAQYVFNGPKTDVTRIIEDYTSSKKLKIEKSIISNQ